ncbi:MFS transporter [Brochothrix thermosphacta]|uniref:MFS transporter n=1 Tax=Brochothrix thermosphacta TaxID=2756 RepID=UPI00083F70E3|nr:MFS transporter [Brochothrix thermosphacta]ODJ60365.1 arabinose transporter permease [Brochothrix thermosphacta]
MKKYPLPIWMLVIGAFAIGMTEFVIMGLLTEVATDLKVSVTQAGQLITMYALSVAIGGPIVVLLTYKLKRKTTLLILMAIFIIGNAIAGVADNYGVMMLSRIVTAFAHGSFFGLGAIIAASLVPKNRQASAMALMFSGLAVANIIGVPFGTIIGQQWGWHASFLIISVIGIIAFAGIWKFVPAAEQRKEVSIKTELSILKSGSMWTTLLISTFSFSSVFAFFTYISPILREVSGYDDNGVALVLIIFGVGVTIGNLVGGRIADWNINKGLIILLVLLEIWFVVLYFIQFNFYLVPFGVFIFGIIAFGLTPSLQFRSMKLSLQAPTLGSALNQSAMNVGNALGAFFGGIIITVLPLQFVVLTAPLLSLVGLVLLLAQISYDKRKQIV